MPGSFKRKHPLAECEECPLYKGDCAPSTGPKDAKIALVSRSPGYYEGIAGKPFSGPSGKILDYLLGEHGVKREEILVTNTVLCHSEGKVPPAAIKACSPRLHGELSSADTVIAAGSEAVKEILGRTGIDRLRGYEHETPVYNKKFSGRVIVTNNPALVLRDDSTFPNLRKDFRLAFNPRPKVILPEVEEINGAKEGVESLHDILGSGRISLAAGDIENRGGLTHRGTLVSFNLAVSSQKGYVYTEEVCGNENFIRCLRDYLTNEEIHWIWHNGKYDVKILRHTYGINARVDEDTMLLGYALDERPGVHALEYMLMDEFGWPNYSSDEIEKFKKGEIQEVPEGFYRYAGLDAAGTFKLFGELKKRASEDNVLDVYYKRLIQDSETLARMELEGVLYDKEAAADINEFELVPEMEKIKSELRRLTEKDLLNPNSHVQMAVIYYDELKLQHPGQARPDMARSVDKDAREGILEGKFTIDLDRQKINKPPQGAVNKKRKLALNIVEGHDRYQSLAKQDSTYIRGLIRTAEKEPDGRVYTEFNIMGTESGRLSSKGPNLQNITRAKEELPNIRRLFSASPGRVIVSGDMSQAELRTIAYVSGDSNLRPIYYDTSRSLHKEMAEQFYGPNYTYEEYVKSKNINFGVAYWQGAFSFSTKYHMPQKEAQAFIDAWWKRFPRVWDWTHEIADEVVKKGVLVNPFGRKRRFYLITRENKDHAQKEGINFMAQSTAWDITGSAMNIIRDEIDWKRGPMVITVHDSVIGDVDEDYVDEWTTIVRQIMEASPKEALGWDIPFKVDISVGPNWGELEEIAA